MLGQHDATRTCGYTTADGLACPEPARPGETRCAEHAPERWTTGGLLGLTDLDIRILRSQGITPEQVAAYPRHLVPSSIRDLVEAGIGPERAQGWPQRFTFGSELVAMITAGLDPATADPYPERFSGSEIVELHRAGLTPSAADNWPVRFDGHDIAYLAAKRLPPRYCDAYPDWMAPSVIARLHSVGVTPEVIAGTADMWTEAMSEDEIEQFLSLL
ncbi:hypothetical protein DVS28_b0267 (plasmid) [Euzebya pacifica]|uniref:Uncharacterized protein n=1 Tax=Euzebya pacifica TaxID=1608957 RepID=A0A346Y6E0_9ACTN|nr:hypothetical protein DVS28_b0267 [Euzebya pacifica]